MATPTASSGATLAPFPIEATRRVLECPHILDSILKYASPSTQAACLRVSSKLYTPAARALYRAVRIDQSNMAAFFRGALIGVASEDKLAECGLAKGDKVCTYINEDLLPRRDERAGPSALPPQYTEGEVELVNRKADLLKFVRILTIAGHHLCLCHLYGPHAARLLPNLDLVRLAPAPVSEHELEVLCDSGKCPLLIATRTRKLVVRNVEELGIPLTDDGTGGPLVYDEVVFILPIDGRRWGEGDDRHRWENIGSKASPYGETVKQLGRMFCDLPTNPAITIVFHPTWEGERADDAEASDTDSDTETPYDPADDNLSESHFEFDLKTDHPVHLDLLLYTLHNFPMGECVTIFGLEKVKTTGDGDFVDVFGAFNPDQIEGLSQQGVHTMIRHDLRTNVLKNAIGLSFDEIEQMDYETGEPELVTYRTWVEYLSDIESRRGELDADDWSTTTKTRPRHWLEARGEARADEAA